MWYEGKNMNDAIQFKRQQWRSRLILLLIVAMFFGSFAIAAILRFAGWQPEHSKNFGMLLNPPIDFSTEVFRRTDGSAYPWKPEENRWRILFVSDMPCAVECQNMLDTLHRVWLSLGRHTERIDMLWVAEVPTVVPDFKGFVPMQANPALAALPEHESAAGYPVYIVDSGGYVVLRYKAGFDPSGLRKDLAKLVK
jgi:hypothetical protein